MPQGKQPYPGGQEGTRGIGTGGYSKYDAANAPMETNGGNDAIHDHVESSGPMPGKSGKSVRAASERSPMK